ETYHQMFSFWGSVAGNVALSCGAFGGVYLTGGMIRQDGVLDIFKTSPFVRSFQNKGRRFEYMHKIPIHVITAHETAFLGLKHILEKNIDRII
ncbi:MAG: glucokinase, partial [Alphaproteobacteria bacterium]|nr:glucokinase [Alphaproteobacteria bacterium]